MKVWINNGQGTYGGMMAMSGFGLVQWINEWMNL